MIEQHVTSLELSKRLKELGVKQESLFYWEQGIGMGYLISSEELIKKFHFKFEDDLCSTAECKTRYSAFLSSELGEMLPGYHPSHKESDGKWRCFGDNHNKMESVKADTEPDARAKMLIHLIEQGIINTKHRA